MRGGGYPQTRVDLVVVAGAKAVEDPCLGDVLVLVRQLPQDPAGREEYKGRVGATLKRVG